MSTVGHPDWNPAPRGYGGALIYPVTVLTVAPGAPQTLQFTPDQLYDLNVIEAQVGQNTLITAQCQDDVGSVIPGPSHLSMESGWERIVMPVRARGKNLKVILSNYDAVNRNTTLAVKGYNGIPLEDLRQPPTSNASNTGVLAPGATAQVSQAQGTGLFDRVGWSAYANQPFTILARRPFIDGGILRIKDEVLAASAAAGVIHGELACSGPGMMFLMRNDGAANITESSCLTRWFYEG